MVAYTNLIGYSVAMSALQKVIDLKGSQAAVAAIVGAKQQSVGYWLTNGLPADHVIPIARDTSWQITPHQLRPDLYPHPDDGLPADRRAQSAEVAND
jgi:DNA-binding transcriptional regulator YdaS (Cro superfamily)